MHIPKRKEKKHLKKNIPKRKEKRENPMNPNQKNK